MADALSDDLEEAAPPPPPPPPTLEEAPPAGLGPEQGWLPRFLHSPTPRPRPAPPADDDPIGFATPSTMGPSSPASTDPRLDPGPKPKSDEVVNPADLQAAVREASDIAFVSIGQTLGFMEKRAKQLPEIDPRWVPTKDERRFVSVPAGRIAKRHMKADLQTLDTIDGLLIAVGVGGFTLRRATGTEQLDDDQ